MAHHVIRGFAPFLVALGVTADIQQPSFDLFSRSLNLAVNNLARFGEGFGRRCAWHRCSQPQPIFVVYRHDEAALASEIEAVEIVGHGLKDHGPRSKFDRLGCPPMRFCGRRELWQGLKWYSLAFR